MVAPTTQEHPITLTDRENPEDGSSLSQPPLETPNSDFSVQSARSRRKAPGRRVRKNLRPSLMETTSLIRET